MFIEQENHEEKKLKQLAKTKSKSHLATAFPILKWISHNRQW